MSLPLVASLVALLVGPLVYRGAVALRAAAAVDAFALVGVGGLVLAHVLPQSFLHVGWWVLPLALAGLFGPGLLCGTRLLSGRRSKTVTMPLALLAIALHALLDGVALSAAGQHPEETGALALAVVLHRLPVGLGIWWLVRPVYGLGAAGALVATIATFSVVGFLAGEPLLAGTSATLFAGVQALLAGSLLHVILRHPPAAHGDAGRRWHAASTVGGLVAVALVVGMGSWHLHGHGVHASESARTFLQLALESAPALLLAYVAVAFVHALLLDLFALLRRGTPLVQALRGTLVGLPVPICSCGVIPLYRSLVLGGVPTTAAMAFLVAAPEVGIAAIVLSWQLLGPEVTLARVGAALVLALVVGWGVGAAAPRRVAVEAPAASGARPPLPRRLADGLRYGFGNMVDDTAPWLLVGLAAAAIAAPLLDAQGLAALSGWVDVPLFALIGMPMYVCASGSTPLVAVLLAKGVSPGAAIAFLLTGPATNLTTFGVLSRLHGRRAALVFAALAIVVTVALGYVVNLGLPAYAAVPPALEDEAPSAVQVASLAALCLLYLVSLLRQGVRGFLAQVISPHGHADGGHDHAHEEACCAPAVEAPRA